MEASINLSFPITTQALGSGEVFSQLCNCMRICCICKALAPGEWGA